MERQFVIGMRCVAIDSYASGQIPIVSDVNVIPQDCRREEAKSGENCYTMGGNE